MWPIGSLGLTWPNVFRSGEVLRRLCIASASRTGKTLFSGGYPHAGIGAEYGSAFAVKGNTPTDSGRHRGTGGKEGVGENQYSDQGEYRDPQPYS